MSANYSSVVLAKGPVGYWRLGEAAGPSAVDASGFGRHGIYKGSPTFGQPGAIVNGPDTAIGCNGPDSKDYVEIVDPGDEAQAVFSQPTSGLGLTVEVWMRPDALVFPAQPSGPNLGDFFGFGSTQPAPAPRQQPPRQPAALPGVPRPPANVGRSAALLMILWLITNILSNVFIKNWLRLRARVHGHA